MSSARAVIASKAARRISPRRRGAVAAHSCCTAQAASSAAAASAAEASATVVSTESSAGLRTSNVDVPARSSPPIHNPVGTDANSCSTLESILFVLPVRPVRRTTLIGVSSDFPRVSDITATPAWQALSRHHGEIRDRHLRELFAEDPDRGTELALTVGDLYIDYSKHRVTRETLGLLVELARTAGLEQHRDAMFAGAHINTSEDRAVLHTAVRLRRDAELVVDGQDVVADVHEVLDRMGDFTDRLRSGEWTGATG